MAQVQRDTIQEWNNGSTTIGPIPQSMNTRVLTALAHSFTHRDNPNGNRNSNIAFQRDLDERLEADEEYQANPSLHRLCYLVSDLIHRWEKLEMQSRHHKGPVLSILREQHGKHDSAKAFPHFQAAESFLPEELTPGIRLIDVRFTLARQRSRSLQERLW